MIKFLKVSLSALLLATFAVAPTVLVLSADFAEAKNGNGGSNGGGNGGGGGGNKDRGGDSGSKAGGGSKGASDKSAARSQSGGKSSKKNGIFGKPKNGLFAKKEKSGGGAAKGNGKFKSDMKALGTQLKSGFGLFKKKRTAKATAPVTRQQAPKKAVVRQPVTQQASEEVGGKGLLHPSNLGKLNGMINSSPNAKLAHIRNGNFGSTVGLAAAMAVAEFEFDQILDDYEVALAVVSDPETAELLDAFDLINGAPTPEEIADAEEVLQTADPASEEYQQAKAIVDYPDTTEAKALTEGVDEDQLRQDVADAQDIVDQGPPDDSEVLRAQDAVLASYKGDLSEEDEEVVLDAVREGFPSEEEIELALDETAQEGDDEDGDESKEGDAPEDDEDDDPVETALSLQTE